MATINLIIKPVKINAIDDILSDYTTSSTNELVDVLKNDILGSEPTVIDSVNTSEFTLGSITNNITSLAFTSNGLIGTSSFTYIIKDNLNNTDQATVTITVNS